MFRLLRLQGYGVLEAAICLLAAKVCGTPIYWYPKAKRRIPTIVACPICAMRVAEPCLSETAATNCSLHSRS